MRAPSPRLPSPDVLPSVTETLPQPSRDVFTLPADLRGGEHAMSQRSAAKLNTDPPARPLYGASVYPAGEGRGQLVGDGPALCHGRRAIPGRDSVDSALSQVALCHPVYTRGATASRRTQRRRRLPVWRQRIQKRRVKRLMFSS